MVAGFKSERWPTSNRNPRPASVGISSLLRSQLRHTETKDISTRRTVTQAGRQAPHRERAVLNPHRDTPRGDGGNNFRRQRSTAPAPLYRRHQKVFSFSQTVLTVAFSADVFDVLAARCPFARCRTISAAYRRPVIFGTLLMNRLADGMFIGANSASWLIAVTCTMSSGYHYLR
jgi:hypothetical protein